MSQSRFVSPRFWLLMSMVLAAVVSRLVPHPPNFSPLAAVALFGGACFASRWIGVLLPMAALLLSDICIYFLYEAGLSASWGIYPGMWVNYACFAAIGVLGWSLRGRRDRVVPVTAGAIASSVLFFVVTNFASWLSPLMNYPTTWAGLMDCYMMGLPFYRPTLLSTLFYTAVLFGGLWLLEKRFAPFRQPAEVSAEEVPGTQDNAAA